MTRDEAVAAACHAPWAESNYTLGHAPEHVAAVAIDAVWGAQE